MAFPILPLLAGIGMAAQFGQQAAGIAQGRKMKKQQERERNAQTLRGLEEQSEGISYNLDEPQLRAQPMPWQDVGMGMGTVLTQIPAAPMLQSQQAPVVGPEQQQAPGALPSVPPATLAYPSLTMPTKRNNKPQQAPPFSVAGALTGVGYGR